MSELAKVFGPKGELWATAPDESWSLRGQPWPAVGELVEACWASRFEDPPTYGFAQIRLKWTDGKMSKWENDRGEDLVFNPDFWKPRAPDSANE